MNHFFASSDIPGIKKVFLIEDSVGNEGVTCCSVEELVIHHYSNEGYPEGENKIIHCSHYRKLYSLFLSGHHHEGRTLHVLYGLYFWDIIYFSVPDVFRTPNQIVPLDYDSLHFYESRKNHFDAR